ncbi:hypothetical protein DUNSADRAFT_4389 [Dunaliella salina]|uniref:Uncharacterized protein n=1 Tax=Dunaliella salina TaxID=3046 RepID=A0ABQ7FUV1_DUNSA|nr:hypothetical protein DUNSADRAFT_4389 [Dunaliella salina]|eukprot:KAF5826175.1 hypothetical protein DUNSADRAFT_4389 [Dunaliella salina]
MNFTIQPNYSVTLRAVGVRHLAGKEARFIFDTEFRKSADVMGACFTEVLRKLGASKADEGNVIVYVGAHHEFF